MVYIAFPIIVILCFIIFILVKNYKISNLDFQKKVQLLESLIKELSQNLEYQNQKVKLSEDLKMKFKSSNYKLSQSIFDLNLDLFNTLYSKK